MGDELLALNGERLRDVIRYQVQADEPEVDVELRRGGIERSVVIRKAAGAPLGLELDSAVFDRVRTCDNHCPFCFIYQLPKGMRRSLYVKDDDYRLSFLYGNFTTLTRFTEADLERVVSERLSPIYVSIHATDPDVRTALLRNRRGATSLRWLALLLEAGIEVHGQIVCCPGVNDGAVLEQTLLDVLTTYPKLVVDRRRATRHQRAQPRARTARAHARRGGSRRRPRHRVAVDLPRRARSAPRRRVRRVLPAHRARGSRGAPLRRVRTTRKRRRPDRKDTRRGARRARGAAARVATDAMRGVAVRSQTAKA